MKTEIVEYIKKRGGGVTFVELCRDVPGFAGEMSVQIPGHNILLWQGVSQEANSAMAELVTHDVIVCKRTAPLTYAIDGCLIDMPLATSMTRKYKHMRWLPVAFSVS